MKWAYMRMWVPDIGMAEAIKVVDAYKNDPSAAIRAHRLREVAEIPRQPEIFLGPINFRDHLNQFATESARSIYGEDHWVDMLLPMRPTDRNPEGWRGNFIVPPRSAEDDPYSFAHFAVITDLRVFNEVERVSRLGGLKVKIKRRDAEEKQRVYYESRGLNPHLFATELPDDLFDVLLINDDNDMEMSYIRTYHMMNEIWRNGIASIKTGHPRPWRIGP